MDDLISDALPVNYNSNNPKWHYNSLTLFRNGDWDLYTAGLTPYLNTKQKTVVRKESKALTDRVHNCNVFAGMQESLLSYHIFAAVNFISVLQT